MIFKSGIATGLSLFISRQRRAKGHLGALVVCLALLIGTSTAHAQCSPTTTLPDVVVSLPPTISVPPNVQNGAVLATVTVPVPGASAGLKYATCSSGSLFWAIAAGPVVANRVGSTSVPGIGYTSSLSGGGLGGTIGMDTTIDSAKVPGGPAGPTFSDQLYVTVNLVKTGPISAGALSLNPQGPGIANRVGSFFVGTGGRTLFNVTMASNATSITSSACTVTTPSTSVALDKVLTRDLTGVGSTAKEVPISIGLNCPSAGTRIFITLTDNSDPTNTSNALSLKAGSSAHGVKFQIVNAGVPVSFGPDSSAAGTINQWQAGTSSGGTMNIPLSVRYIQTATPVQGGTANAAATFTMSYQ